MTKRRVLVTGALGWLGSSLVEALTQGFRSGVATADLRNRLAHASFQ